MLQTRNLFLLHGRDLFNGANASDQAFFQKKEFLRITQSKSVSKYLQWIAPFVAAMNIGKEIRIQLSCGETILAFFIKLLKFSVLPSVGIFIFKLDITYREKPDRGHEGLFPVTTKCPRTLLPSKEVDINYITISIFFLLIEINC